MRPSAMIPLLTSAAAQSPPVFVAVELAQVAPAGQIVQVCRQGQAVDPLAAAGEDEPGELAAEPGESEMSHVEPGPGTERGEGEGDGRVDRSAAPAPDHAGRLDQFQHSTVDDPVEARRRTGAE